MEKQCDRGISRPPLQQTTSIHLRKRRCLFGNHPNLINLLFQPHTVIIPGILLCDSTWRGEKKREKIIRYVLEENPQRQKPGVLTV